MISQTNRKKHYNLSRNEPDSVISNYYFQSTGCVTKE